ncbi:MAG: phosphatase PAP2 family protein [Ignavibacteriales bacterium]|nr:phosphatase PAP2 family protein [Ignavibacteriales bacterium]
MIEFLYSIDKWIFCFINQTLSNPIFDFLMPFITDWNLYWIGRGIAIILWLLLFWRGGKRGRTVALLLILLILITDQFNGVVLKQLFNRPRPCHMLNGHHVVDTVHLLVGCGGGLSFPSSHATNNLAFAAFISYYYPRWKIPAFSYGILMALSRIFVGVHYPSDVLIGGIIGMLWAYLLITLWESAGRQYPGLKLEK